MSRFAVNAAGRPAPQGSKKSGQHGQMIEQSVYLPAWRAAVKRAVYERYRALGVDRETLPLIRGAVAMTVTFWLYTGHRIDGPPDVDKLLRSTFDALTQARVYEDDARVVWVGAGKCDAPEGHTGAQIEVWGVEL